MAKNGRNWSLFVFLLVSCNEHFDGNVDHLPTFSLQCSSMTLSLESWSMNTLILCRSITITHLYCSKAFNTICMEDLWEQDLNQHHSFAHFPSYSVSYRSIYIKLCYAIEFGCTRLHKKGWGYDFLVQDFQFFYPIGNIKLFETACVSWIEVNLIQGEAECKYPSDPPLRHLPSVNTDHRCKQIGLTTH